VQVRLLHARDPMLAASPPEGRVCDSTIVAGSTHVDLGRSAAGMRVITHGTLTAIVVSSTLNPPSA
jgi:hypothetical protein